MEIKNFVSALFLIFALLTGNIKSSFGAIDVGVTAIINPVCPVNPGFPESIIVVLTNFGTTPMTSINVGFSIIGMIPVIETWNGSLAPLASDTFEFSATVVFPAGQFSFCSYTLQNDADPFNDTTCICTPTSVLTYEENSNKIIISPNPAPGIFSLRIKDEFINYSIITITDVQGKAVWRNDVLNPEFYIDLTNQPDGLYLVTITSPTVVINSKLFLDKHTGIK